MPALVEYTPSGQLQIPVDGADNVSVMANAIARTDALLGQTTTISLTGSGDFAATLAQIRFAVIVLTDSPSGARDFVIPENTEGDNTPFKKLFVNTTGETITVSYATGDGVDLAPGATAELYGDGVDVKSGSSSAAPAPVALTMTGDTTATSDHVAASLLVLRGSPASGSLLTLPNITFSIFVKNETGVDIDVTRSGGSITDTLPDGYMRNYYHVS